MSQKSLTKVATNRLVIVFSECSSVRPAPSLEDIRKRKLCVGAVRGGGCATTMSTMYRLLTSIPASWSVDLIHLATVEVVTGLCGFV